MSDFLIIKFFGLSTFKNPLYNKIIIIANIFIIWITFIIRVSIPWNINENYKMSLFITIFVYLIIILGATFTLIESFRTIHLQKILQFKLESINFQFNFFTKSKNYIFKINFLKFYINSCIFFTVLYILITFLGQNEGTYFFYIYPSTLLKTRIFQITLILDKFLSGFFRFKKQLLKYKSFESVKVVKHLKITYNKFLDFNTIFHQCFECSIFSISICFLGDYICSIYWFVLPLLNLFPYHNLAICFSTMYILGLQFYTICKICEFIKRQVCNFKYFNINLNFYL